jgi:hypothetical protein
MITLDRKLAVFLNPDVFGDVQISSLIFRVPLYLSQPGWLF